MAEDSTTCTNCMKYSSLRKRCLGLDWHRVCCEGEVMTKPATPEFIPCPFCGFSDMRLHGVPDGLEGVECKTCGVVVWAPSGTAIIDVWNSRSDWHELPKQPQSIGWKNHVER